VRLSALGRPGWYNRLPARRSLGIDARRDPISEILAARAQLGQAFARQVAHPGLQVLHAGADLIIALRFALAGLGRGGSGCFRIQCGGNLRLGQVHLRPGHSGRPGFIECLAAALAFAAQGSAASAQIRSLMRYRELAGGLGRSRVGHESQDLVGVEGRRCLSRE
jgi:hypothetical protein